LTTVGKFKIAQTVSLAHGALIALLVMISVPAHAGPPFRTDDPEAVEYRHGEFYIFSQQTLTGDGHTGVLPALEFNYGVYPNVQLHLVTPWAFATPHGEGYYNLDEHNHVLFSAGKGLQNAAQTNRVSTYVGYQYTF
jgi:hypothetical protein